MNCTRSCCWASSPARAAPHEQQLVHRGRRRRQLQVGARVSALLAALSSAVALGAKKPVRGRAQRPVVLDARKPVRGSSATDQQQVLVRRRVAVSNDDRRGAARPVRWRAPPPHWCSAAGPARRAGAATVLVLSS